MRSDNSPQRLACPRCRANNFVGQAQCWQCKASLPPPEAMNTPTVMGWGQQVGTPPAAGMQATQVQPVNPQGNWQSPAGVSSAQEMPVARRRGSKMPLIMAGALLTASAMVWFAFHRSALPPANTSGLSLPPGVSTAGTEGVLPDGILPGSHDIRFAQPERDPMPVSADPTEAAARRAVQRAIPRLGLPPGTDSDGNVHLRNGSTISREQYEATQEKLKNNPLLGGPPTVPRL